MRLLCCFGSDAFEQRPDGLPSSMRGAVAFGQPEKHGYQPSHGREATQDSVELIGRPVAPSKPAPGASARTLAVRGDGETSHKLKKRISVSQHANFKESFRNSPFDGKSTPAGGVGADGNVLLEAEQLASATAQGLGMEQNTSLGAISDPAQKVVALKRRKSLPSAPAGRRKAPPPITASIIKAVGPSDPSLPSPPANEPIQVLHGISEDGQASPNIPEVPSARPKQHDTQAVHLTVPGASSLNPIVPTVSSLRRDIARLLDDPGDGLPSGSSGCILP